MNSECAIAGDRSRMMQMTLPYVCVGLMLLAPVQGYARLVAKLEGARLSGSKAVVKLTLKNTFTNTVESARATLFLMNDQDKVVGQKSEWVIGGKRDKSALAPDATTTYNFVVPADKPFTKTKVVFNRIVLEGGKQVDPSKNVVIEQSN